jgi:hypothetical protein
LKIIGNINSIDGWIKAKLNDQEGLVSIHYIKMLDKNKNTIKFKKQRKITKKIVDSGKKAIALFDFIPPQDREDILAFKKNDIIEMKSKKHVGWWNGILDGKKGLVPIKYIKFLDDEDNLFEKSNQDGKNNKDEEENNMEDNNQDPGNDDDYQFFTENSNVDLYEVQKMLGTPSNSSDSDDEEEEKGENEGEKDINKKIFHSDKLESEKNKFPSQSNHKSEPTKRKSLDYNNSKSSNTEDFDSFPTIQSIQTNNQSHLTMLKKQNHLFQKNLPFIKQIKKGDSHLFISNTDMSSGLFSRVPNKMELVNFYTDIISTVLESAGYQKEEQEQIMNLVKLKTNHSVTISKATRDIVIFLFNIKNYDNVGQNEIQQ